MAKFSDAGGGTNAMTGKMINVVFVNDELTGYLCRCVQVEANALLLCDMDPTEPMEFWCPLSSIWRIYPTAE